MSVQGHLLDITVVGCRNLKDTEWLSRQDPYVILEYAGNKYRTKTDTDGGRNPTFNEKYMLPLIQGLQEINVTIWNSNTLSKDDFIGSGKILLQKVLTDGYHDSTWPLTARNGRRSGEIRVILHYADSKGQHNRTPTQHAPPVPPSSHVHYTPPTYAAPSAYPPSQPSGHGGYPPAYAPYAPPGQSPSYPPYGSGGYTPPMPHGAQSPYPPYGPGGYTPPMPHGAQSPYTYPPQSYPPQAYPPHPPPGYGAPPSAPYPPY